LYGISADVIVFRRLSSTASMPIFSAMASISRSRTNVVS
jgi:hypothetical protein